MQAPGTVEPERVAAVIVDEAERSALEAALHRRGRRSDGDTDGPCSPHPQDTAIAAFRSVRGTVYLGSLDGATLDPWPRLVVQRDIRCVVVCARSLSLPQHWNCLTGEGGARSSSATGSAVEERVSIVHLPALPDDGWHSGPLASRGDDSAVPGYLEAIAGTIQQEMDEERRGSAPSTTTAAGGRSDCSSGVGSPIVRRRMFFVHVPLEDNKTQRLPPQLLHAAGALIDVLHAATGGGGVLVHCLKGASRSVCLTAAFLMQFGLAPDDDATLSAPGSAIILPTGASSSSPPSSASSSSLPPVVHRYGFIEVLEAIRRQRPQADPNNWFRLQMMKYQRSLAPSSAQTAPRP